MFVNSTPAKQRWLCFLFFILFKLGITSLYISSAVTGLRASQGTIWEYLIVGVIFIVLAHKLSIKKVLDIFIVVSLVTALAHYVMVHFQYSNSQPQLYLSRLASALVTISLPLSWATVFTRINKSEAKAWALILGLVSGVFVGGLSILQYIAVLDNSPGLLIVTSILFLGGAWLAIRFCESGDSMKAPNGKTVLWSVIIMLVFILIDLLEANLSLIGKWVIRELANSQAPEYGMMVGEMVRIMGIVSMATSVVMLIVSQLILIKKGMHFTTMFLLLIVGAYSLLSYALLPFWKDQSIVILGTQKGVFSGLKYYLLILFMMQAYRFMVETRFQALSFIALVPFFTGLMKPLPSAIMLFFSPETAFKNLVFGHGVVFLIIFGITLYFAYRLTAKKWEVTT